MEMTSMELQKSTANSVPPCRPSTQDRKTEDLWRPVSQWGAEDIAIWLRGVEKVPRAVLESVLRSNMNGSQLLHTTSDQLAELGVDSVGKRYCILAAVSALKSAETYICKNPVVALGSSLLSAGKDLETAPVRCVLSMVETITHTLSTVDRLLSSEDYLTCRQEILAECGQALKLITDTQDTSPHNRPFVKKCKGFVRAVLPHLQGLKAMVDVDEALDINDCLHCVTIHVPPGAQAGISIRQNDARFIYISNLTPQEPADQTGLLSVGDEIVSLNAQNIIGWRTRSVAALLKQSTSAMQVVVRVPASEFDTRIDKLVEHARALRNSVSSSSSRPPRGSSCASRRVTGSSASTPRSSVAKAMLTGETERDAGIDIVSPCGREQWCIGTTQTIKWEAPDLPRETTLSIRTISKRACFNLQVAPVVMNTGEFAWKLTTDVLPSDDYQIIISAVVGDQEIVAISRRFSVLSAPPPVDQHPPAREQTPQNGGVEARAIILKPDGAGSYGFDIDAQFVSDIEPHGAAYKDGRLRIGDQIIEINGSPVRKLSHIAIDNLLQESSEEMTLVVAGNMAGYQAYLDAYSEVHATYSSQLVCRQVDLQPTPSVEAFGLSLMGSHNVITIGSVMEGLPASKCPHLQTSTGIVQVNGCAAYGASVLDVLKFMSFHKESTLSLVVTQDTDQYVRYANDVLRLREEQLLTEVECSAATAAMASGGAKRRSRSNSTSSVKAVRMRQLSFDRRNSAASSEADSYLAEPIVETPCQSISNPALQGWLTKQGGSGLTPRNWRRRYFVLKKNGNCYYFKTPTSSVALGCFSLRGALVMPPPPKKHMYNKHGFKISRTDKRSYYICADTAEEMKTWMNALSLAAIQYSPGGEDTMQSSDDEDCTREEHARQAPHGSAARDHRESCEYVHGHHHHHHHHHYRHQRPQRQEEYHPRCVPRGGAARTAALQSPGGSRERLHTRQHAGGRGPARLSNTSAHFAHLRAHDQERRGSGGRQAKMKGLARSTHVTSM